MMPHSTFHPLLYKQLINLATATSYLPDVVGQILLIQGTNIKNPVATTKVVIALLLSSPTYLQSHNTYSSKSVRLILMDNASALFRELHCRTDLKHEVVIITSINPKVCKGNIYRSYMVVLNVV
ncbi:hypothetical protein YC2023_017812 [Brassica napus]